MSKDTTHCPPCAQAELEERAGRNPDHDAELLLRPLQLCSLRRDALRVAIRAFHEVNIVAARFAEEGGIHGLHVASAIG